MPSDIAIVIPTGGRRDYLDVALRSIVPQARAAGADVLVVEDGPEVVREVAERHGARYLSFGEQRGLNTARNAGVEHTDAPLVAFVDDDVEVRPGWLAALAAGAVAYPEHEAFTGPIHARLEGGGPRRCGREGPPISFLDLGPEDRDAERGWGANLAIRRSAFERIGSFDTTYDNLGAGDEEEWERRLLAAGGRIRYLATAALDHRRTAEDSRLRPLTRAAFHRGRAARRFDARRGEQPPRSAELRVLAGCLWHAGRYRCTNGLLLAAHSLGRLRG